MTAADYSQASLDALQAKFSGALIHFACADVTRLPFPDASYDRTLFANTLQHLPTPDSRRAAIAELARVTKPGGVVVVSAHQWSKAKQRAGWKKEGKPGGDDQPDYIYRFEPDEFCELLCERLTDVRLFGAGYNCPRDFVSLSRHCNGFLLQPHAVTSLLELARFEMRPPDSACQARWN